MSRVLDASAVLAFLHVEPGAERVRDLLDGAVVSTVNWAEVIQKALHRDVDVTGMHVDFTDLGVEFAPFTPAQAERAAALWQTTRERGLSLADRACLALAIDRQTAVVTADRTWGDLALGIDVELLR